MDTTIYIQERNIFSILFLNKLVQLLFSSKMYKDVINLYDIESEIYTSLILDINDKIEENSSVNS